MGTVFLSPLNWGLGHASRDIPLIQELLRRGHEVTIGACGNALVFLKKEFPSLDFIGFQDYPQPYNNGKLFLPTFTGQMPALVRAFDQERRATEAILSERTFDLIVSDSRPGVYSPRVPSLQITHQVHQSLPFLIWPLELIGVQVNMNAFRKYEAIIVPDNPPGEKSIAGKLSRALTDRSPECFYYAGILASIPQKQAVRDIDYLIVISGMEPQRSELERILLPQVRDLPGKKVILLGKPASGSTSELDDGTLVYSYLPNDEKAMLFARVKFIIGRSGYTTMMDVAEAGISGGLFIPTPGQWEQEYLARYYEAQGWFFCRNQYRVRLSRDIERASEFSGFPEMPRTGENIRNLYDGLIAHYLER